MGVYGETAEPLSGVQESLYAGGERIYSGDETSFTTSRSRFRQSGNCSRRSLRRRSGSTPWITNFTVTCSRRSLMFSIRRSMWRSPEKGEPDEHAGPAGCDFQPGKATKFENCVADVNIPLGEVFTSPKLAGTNGILNVGTVYIGDIQYRNLRMEFKDGRVVSAVCDNFVENGVIDQEAGHRLIVQGIMNGHETAPLGEFAIGTNTTAYAMAEEVWNSGPSARSLSSRRWDRTLQLATPATAGLRTARCTIRTARR